MPQSFLRHYQPKLVECINLEALVPHLNRLLVLTDHENEILLNQHFTHRQRLLHLLERMEHKGDTGLLRFLEALAAERSHLGHQDLDEELAPYRRSCN